MVSSLVVCLINIVLLNFCAPAVFANSVDYLSPQARKIAKDIGVNKPIVKLKTTIEHSIQNTGTSTDQEINRLHNKVLDKVILAWLQVRATLAQIDQDITKTAELRTKLQAKAERNVNIVETIAFLNAGIGEIFIGTGLMAKPMSLTGGIISMYGGTAEVALSALALKLERGGRIDVQKAPNMLAAIVGFKEGESLYPATVLSYLNDPTLEPGSAENRIEALRQHWIKIGFMPAPTSADGQRIISLLAATHWQSKALTIKILSNRLFMLNELRTVVASMDSSITEIVSYAINLDPLD